MDESKTVREQGKLQRKDKDKVSCGVTATRLTDRGKELISVCMLCAPALT